MRATGVRSGSLQASPGLSGKRISSPCGVHPTARRRILFHNGSLCKKCGKNRHIIVHNPRRKAQLHAWAGLQRTMRRGPTRAAHSTALQINPNSPGGVLLRKIFMGVSGRCSGGCLLGRYMWLLSADFLADSADREGLLT